MDQDLNNLVKVDQYRRCINLLQKKCEGIHKENERLVHRLYVIKRIARRRNREVALIKNRLDLHNDSWRTAEPEPWPKIEKDESKASGKNGMNGKKGKANGTNAKEKKTGTKKKRAKTEKEKDPNAPKRPANPFFQFCQEQRSIIMDELNSELQPGEPETTKQELTRQLAHRWRTLDSNDKQIYVNMYESSKQKYNQEMLSYKKDVVDKDKKIQ